MELFQYIAIKIVESKVLCTFNNRDISIILWFLAIFVLALFQKDIRVSLFSVLNTFFSKNILIPFFLMLFYIFPIINLLHRIGFWDILMLKGTILWFFGVAFIMFMNSNNVNKNEHYFRNIVSSSLRMVLILEFIINFYALNIIAEIILIPFITLVVVTNSYAEIKKLDKVKKALTPILMIFGLWLFGYACYKIIGNFKGFFTADNLRAFLLPPILTLVFLPFIYFMALYILYETIFKYLSWKLDNDAYLIKYARRKIFITCHFNLRKLKILFKKADILKVINKEDIQKALQNIKTPP